MDEFENFSFLHGLCILACLVISVAAILLLKRKRGTDAADFFRQVTGWGCLAIWLVGTLYRSFILPFSWAGSLPLQFCHLANLVGAAAVLMHWRLFQSVLYFWTFALCSWAFITPDLGAGPSRPGFWIFWLYHVFILLAVIDVLVAQRFRPNWSDFRNAVFFTLALAGLLAIINRIFSWNYGFVGPYDPSVPTVIDFLGPYPIRLLSMAIIGVLLFLCLMLPWMKKRA